MLWASVPIKMYLHSGLLSVTSIMLIQTTKTRVYTTRLWVNSVASNSCIDSEKERCMQINFKTWNFLKELEFFKFLSLLSKCALSTFHEQKYPSYCLILTFPFNNFSKYFYFILYNSIYILLKDKKIQGFFSFISNRRKRRPEAEDKSSVTSPFHKRYFLHQHKFQQARMFQPGSWSFRNQKHQHLTNTGFRENDWISIPITPSKILVLVQEKIQNGNVTKLRQRKSTKRTGYESRDRNGMAGAKWVPLVARYSHSYHGRVFVGPCHSGMFNQI